LQYVLLEPDKIEGVGRSRTIPASAGRPYGQVEATVLPGHGPGEVKKDDCVKEWKKFDMIVLGDVSRRMLSDYDMEALEKFVGERGGTLVVIAGPRYMPHTFANTPLEHMLPAVFEPGDHYVRAPVKGGDEKAEKTAPRGFKIALTPEGQRHAIMKQLDDREENSRLWRSMPKIYWRYPIGGTKVAATVLAYAAEPSNPSAAADKNPSAEELRKLRQLQRRRALISVQRYKSGRVLFLSFDRTWRFRYRVGDTYHHRFWGQVLRWATGDKLPAGTRLVRLGTNKVRYGPEEQVKVEAKIFDHNFDPIAEADSKDIAVKIFKLSEHAASKNAPERKPAKSDWEPVHEKKLSPVKGMPGRFEAELGEVGDAYGPGEYRVELHGAAVEKILKAEDKQDGVATRFHVAESTYDEQRHLAPDPAAAEEIARASNGKVVRPHEAAALTEPLGPGVEVRTDLRQSSLWDTWPMLVIIVAAAAAEWILRKRIGLA
jgi:hypothetical protein